MYKYFLGRNQHRLKEWLFFRSPRYTLSILIKKNIALTIQQLLDLERFYFRFNCVSVSAAFPGGNV